MEEVILHRFSKEQNQTIGKLVYKDVECYTLELPYKNNNRNISCIPVGLYNVERRYSTKYKYHFHITNVPDRSLILIHHGNFNYQTRGCILVGEDIADINADGAVDVTNSKATMRLLLKELPEQFRLRII